MMFPISHNDETETWQGADYHKFLMNNFERAVQLKMNFNELPETTLLVSKDRVNMPAHVSPELFWLVGSWPAPPHITQSKTQKFVNPNHPDRWKYSNVYVRCDCGAVMELMESRESPWTVKHTDCPVYQRYKARAELSRKRAACIRTICRLYKSLTAHAPFFGYSEGHFRSSLLDSLGIDGQHERSVGRQLMANTCVRLLEDYTPQEVSEVYGVHWKAIHRAVNNLTDTTIGELQEKRREHRSH